MQLDIHDFDEYEQPDDYRERFTIEDDAQAAWAMRKCLAARVRRDDNIKVAQAERHRIDSWLAAVNQRAESDISYFEGILTEYASRERALGRKTIDTPYGVVKSRQGQPKIAIADADEFIAWAREGHEELLVVKVSPSISAIKALAEIEVTESLGVVAITPDGEVIPGLDVQPAAVGYVVEVSK